ncbi:hypothetical protein [Anabaena azotica]|uniref:AB hydrolase-1 domain-containing protein n=1 Tax=Anabaena azotica FACHB-119 TaxID=947527 RepID=A0ABR8D9B2_9NOST|nr:hypothetical protein [Anabaena azotica]MBD2502880.1 hypothetical protein [Anabaena azotica FACHB-119]
MTTIIFVHGTGVRQPEYEGTFQIIKQKIHDRNQDIIVAPCLWGDVCGTKLNANGATVPLYDGTLALNETETEDADILLWRELYRYPLYELRSLSLISTAEGSSNPFGEQPSDILQARVENFTPSAELEAELSQAGIAGVFGEARDTVINSQPYAEILPKISESELSEYAAVIARAIIAQAMRISEKQQRFPPILTDAQMRDRVVKLLTLSLAEAELGLGGWLLQPLLHLGTNYVKRRRGAATDKISPIPCDVLFYQTRGEKIRAFIQEQIAQAEPPVVLLAHSLGGIACVDLLVQQPISQVELLVTVGSQAPFLYEINALHSLEYGQPLPEHFPKWLNIYDLRDFLSYVGSRIFPKVEDVEVNSQQPFPRSHNAYWTNATTWEAIFAKLP